MTFKSDNQWTIADAAKLYGVDAWGVGNFGITEQGELAVTLPHKGGVSKTSLLDIIHGLEQRGNSMPVLLRIENLLDERLKTLNESFAKAIDGVGYQGEYRGVFPIKVNQQCHVVEEIAKFGEQYHHGFEAGSKAELIVAMTHLRDTEACIICNGYKDAEFIELGLQAKRLGLKCFFVIETPSELAIIFEQSKKLGIEPLIGVRVKLAAKVEGHWFEDSGDRSLFGLNSIQLMEVVDQLREADMLHCLQLMHYHIGSQIPNIRNIRDGVLEACRYYADLVKEGASLNYLDLGGGLAVDYTGASANETHSKNYSLEEYCVDIVETISASLNKWQIPHPTIITESGRATVAYSSVLLFNILDIGHFKSSKLPDELPQNYTEPLANLWETVKSVSPDNIQECCNDALNYRQDIRLMFNQGQVQLRELAMAENFYLEVLQQVRRLLPHVDRVPPELQNLDESLADIYYGNFSLFQSLPDAWAIDQIFPVMPVHRLQEEPKNTAVIADITCDSDGKLDLFSGINGEAKTLRLHDLLPGEEYYLGVFLIGAYQETLGDLHNLFGDTHVVSIRISDDGDFDVVDEIEGDSIGDVLSYVEYNPKQIYEQFRVAAENAVKAGRINVSERQQALNSLSQSLNGYTYFERD